MTGPTAEDLIRRIVGAAPEVDPPPEAVEPVDYRLAWYTLNDLGNAQRLVERFGDDLLWVEGMGWLAWTGTHWDAESGDRRARRFAHDTAMRVFREAKAMDIASAGGDDDDEDAAAARGRAKKRTGELRAWAIESGDTKRLNGMMREAQALLSCTIDDLDADPLRFTVLNGTIVVDGRPEAERGKRRGTDRIRLVDHDRRHRITRCAPVEYRPGAAAPVWEGFLAGAQPSAEMRRFLQISHGYAGVTGLQREQKIVCHTGVGANGKSTFIETLEHLFGPYAYRLPFESLLHDRNRSGAAATPDLAKLPARRFVVASESEPGTVLSSKRIKDLTERTEMTVRDLFGKFFTFTPQHHVVLMFNERPHVPATDDGTWRRVALVEWPVRFIWEYERNLYPDAPLRDDTISDRLLEELSGILCWLLDGVRLYFDEGYQLPEAVQAATRAYREENDPVGSFIRMIVRRAEGRTITGKEFYQKYCRWSELNGRKPVTGTRFGRDAKKIIKADDSSGIVKYLDVEIDPSWDHMYGRQHDERPPWPED